MNKQDCHAFAVKWLAKYEDDNTPGGELEERFADDCFALGLEMDCGESFASRYDSDAFVSPDAFAAIVEAIDDPIFLGTAIFSKWRAITHWWYEDLFEKRNRRWFILAFSRLKVITEHED